MSEQNGASNTFSIRCLQAFVLGITIAAAAGFLYSHQYFAAFGVVFFGGIASSTLAALIVRPIAPADRRVEIEYANPEFRVMARLNLEDIDAFHKELETFRDSVSEMKAAETEEDNVVDFSAMRRRSA